MMVWLNGEWKEEDDAAVAVSDGAFLRGEGVFETMLALKGKVFEAERHWRRLSLGCKKFGFQIQTFEEIQPILHQLLERNELQSHSERVRVRMTKSFGNFLMTAQVSPAYPKELILTTTNYCRNEKSPLRGLKAISYAENSLSLAEGKRAGAHEVLFANTNGDWCEGAWSNIFAVEAGVLVTPPLQSGCLVGVTRELILEMARDSEMEVREEARKMSQISQADELFLTSSLLGIGAVRKFDGRDFEEGPLTKRLKGLLCEREERF